MCILLITLSFTKDIRLILQNTILLKDKYKSKYDVKYFLEGDTPERASYFLKIIRPQDMGAAIMYATGTTNYDSVVKLLGIDKNNPLEFPRNTNCIRQANLLKQNMTRVPKCVIDIGCGRGELSATLRYMGINTIAVDPSDGAAELVMKTHSDFYNIHECNFIHKTLVEGMKEILKENTPDTIIFCESIEHIDATEFQEGFELIKKALRQTSGLLIITNWIHYHPIPKNPRYDWNHIHLIDDKFYDMICDACKKIIFRERSHLVVQF